MPVINGLTDLCHPCQALSDLLTIQEKKGHLKAIKIGYVGDGNNVANSLIEAAAKMGMAINLGCPSGYEPDQRILDLSQPLNPNHPAESSSYAVSYCRSTCRIQGINLMPPAYP